MKMQKEKLELFIGPCVLESQALAEEIAGSLKEQLEEFFPLIQLTFKGSFDKANRTSINSYRGPGMEEGLKILQSIRKNFGFPVVTDMHLPDQADAIASVVDVVQIPAFLCRQTDLVVAGAQACQKYSRRLKVKKGQFLAPDDVGNIVEKVSNFLPKSSLLLTERGSSFGYHNLIVDMASFMIMQSYGVKVIYDATHSVQRPGGLGHQTGGKREQIEVLARAAVAAGANGVFMETHPNPEKALSDSATALPLTKIKHIVAKLIDIYQVV